MFRVTAEYDGQIEVGVGADEAHKFFSESRNFVELMTGVEAIDELPEGNRRWTISAAVPVIGSIKQQFVVAKTEDTPERIEWSPAPGEVGNLLRYTADIATQRGRLTSVSIRQKVEVRREKASELHMMAGWVGEERISREMQRGVTAMMDEFMRKAKARLRG